MKDPEPPVPSRSPLAETGPNAESPCRGHEMLESAEASPGMTVLRESGLSTSVGATPSVGSRSASPIWNSASVLVAVLSASAGPAASNAVVAHRA